MDRKNEEEIVLQEAKNTNLKYADVRKIKIQNPPINIIGNDDIIKFNAFPLTQNGETLFVGITNLNKPGLFDLVSDLKNQYSVVLVLISKSSFLELVSKYNIRQSTTEEEISDDDLAQGLVLVNKINLTTIADLNKVLLNSPIQLLLPKTIEAAISIKCSDLHIEPEADNAKIRARIDGKLHQIGYIPKDTYQHLLSQIIINSDLQLDLDRPQNGHLKIIYRENREEAADIRVEVIPVLHGKEIVMRVFYKNAILISLNDIGLNKHAFPIIKEVITRPHGSIIVSGPTGSGKSTTLYALINELNSEDRKIVTLEDPIEYEVKGISQSQVGVNEKFIDRLRAVMREDPDIIMIGEIRDTDTAKTALQSALTGHLLLSTFHANSASVALTRIVDMVGDTNLVTAALNLIIAQRLVRKNCPFCKKEVNISQEEKNAVKDILSSLPEKYKADLSELKFFEGTGCDRCMGMGYKGRIGVFEVLKITAEIQQMIVQKSLPSVIQAIAIKNGMITMEQDGILKALAGITTVSEVLSNIKE
jgi:type II secretory ATPase GspE/PulE/Tfp pilus assembly ATPase PilB-like protein